MVREHIGKLSKRKARSHKGDYGRVLVIAGSKGMTGAACLCSMGALRAGSGLVYNVVAESLEAILQIKLTEALTIGVAETRDLSPSLKAEKKIMEHSDRCDVVAMGPGLGQNKDTAALTKKLIQSLEKPLVLDADGIKSPEVHPEIIAERKAPIVITPHPGELSSFLRTDIASIQEDREKIALQTASDLGCVVCLKGHNTVVAADDGRVFVNPTGNSSMATGGTGDILTGVIASFIGQGVDVYSSTVIAVYLHGLAGDIASQKKGMFGVIASDLLDTLPEAFQKASI